MPTPDLQPASTVSAIRLPSTGTAGDVSTFVTYGVYNSDTTFLSGAATQVTYVYNRLGGNILDIELEPRNVYDSYEDAVLEYSRLINNHQAKSVLYSFLGSPTGTFDHTGEFKSGSVSSSFSGAVPALQFPRFTFTISHRAAEGFAESAGIGGTKTHYSASVSLVVGRQEYDLEAAVVSLIDTLPTSSALATEYSSSINKRIKIEKVYYVSPSNIWRFYGYYGGLNVVGNLFSYGQYADESTFEVIPIWQNKLQAITFENNLFVRASHYSYEIRNNRMKIYPPPTDISQFGLRQKIWFEFTIDKNPFEDAATGSHGVNGVNNINTLPFANIPYCNINSMGKDWIRKWSLATCKETLGNLRGKVQAWPYGGESVTLNYQELLSQAEKEKERLKEELMKYLDELTYDKLAEIEANLGENAQKLQTNIPTKIYVG